MKVGIHRGPSIAVTLNERLDYFGQTVNIAARVQGQANGDEICMSRDVVDAAGVGDLLAGFAVAQQDILLKGIERPVVVFRAGSRRPDL